MSRFIGQSLAFESLQRKLGALSVVDAEFGAGIHAEIKLRQVPVKVFVIHVLIDPDQATLEDAEIAFESIGVNVAAYPFTLGMVNRFVLIFARHDEAVDVGTIGDQAAGIMQMLVHGTADVAMIQVHGTDIAAALDQGEYHRRGLGIQRGPNGLAGLGRLAEVSFVGFDGLAESADHAAVVLHGFTDAMTQEPRGFHAAIKHPLNLAGADAFLAGAHQMDDLQPQMQRQVAGLKNGPHTHGERLLAAVTLAKAWTGGLAVQAADAITGAAKRANGTVGPEMRFDVFESSGFGFELGGGKDRGGHGGISYGQIVD